MDRGSPSSSLWLIRKRKFILWKKSIPICTIHAVKSCSAKHCHLRHNSTFIPLKHLENTWKYQYVSCIGVQNIRYDFSSISLSPKMTTLNSRPTVFGPFYTLRNMDRGSPSSSLWFIRKRKFILCLMPQSVFIPVKCSNVEQTLDSAVQIWTTSIFYSSHI